MHFFSLARALRGTFGYFSEHSRTAWAGADARERGHTHRPPTLARGLPPLVSLHQLQTPRALLQGCCTEEVGRSRSRTSLCVVVHVVWRRCRPPTLWDPLAPFPPTTAFCKFGRADRRWQKPTQNVVSFSVRIIKHEVESLRKKSAFISANKTLRVWGSSAPKIGTYVLWLPLPALVFICSQGFYLKAPDNFQTYSSSPCCFSHFRCI